MTRDKLVYELIIFTVIYSDPWEENGGEIWIELQYFSFQKTFAPRFRIQWVNLLFVDGLIDYLPRKYFTTNNNRCKVMSTPNDWDVGISFTLKLCVHGND